MKKFKLLAVLIVLSIPIWAQLGIEKQIELNEDEYGISYKAQMINKDLVLFTHETLLSGKLLEIHFDSYNANLELQKSKKTTYSYAL